MKRWVTCLSAPDVHPLPEYTSWIQRFVCGKTLTLHGLISSAYAQIIPLFGPLHYRRLHPFPRMEVFDIADRLPPLFKGAGEVCRSMHGGLRVVAISKTREPETTRNKRPEDSPPGLRCLKSINRYWFLSLWSHCRYRIWNSTSVIHNSTIRGDGFIHDRQNPVAVTQIVYHSIRNCRIRPRAYTGESAGCGVHGLSEQVGNGRSDQPPLKSP